VKLEEFLFEANEGIYLWFAVILERSEESVTIRLEDGFFSRPSAEGLFQNDIYKQPQLITTTLDNLCPEGYKLDDNLMPGQNL
jgi:hypothetical protein